MFLARIGDRGQVGEMLVGLSHRFMVGGRNIRQLYKPAEKILDVFSISEGSGRDASLLLIGHKSVLYGILDQGRDALELEL